MAAVQTEYFLLHASLYMQKLKFTLYSTQTEELEYYQLINVCHEFKSPLKIYEVGEICTYVN